MRLASLAPTILLVMFFPVSAFAAAPAKQQPNVLFIAVDDLNHWVGHLGRHPQAKTPNIDRLAASGVTFVRAYCAAPSCNPSRAALMSGLRPSTTGVYDNGQNWKKVIGPEQTLTTQFLKAGYHVYGAGKIYHSSEHRPAEWTDYYEYEKETLRLHPTAKNNGVGGIRFAPVANEDHELTDHRVVDYALEKLQQTREKPFFLAVGIYKPHMPWNVPKKYFDLFPLEEIQLPPHREDDLADIPQPGLQFAKPQGDHAKMLESGRWKEAVQAYLAAIAFADVQVGRLLDGLEQSPHADNTIVVLWGDHGWHLGEKEHWRKFALWEEACRMPLIWKAPGVTQPGGVCDQPVDLMAVYPTLCDLAGLATPPHVEGISLRPLLEDPEGKWDLPAVTTFRRDNHRIRTERWAYIRYANGDEELYDHAEDPYEWTNLAKDPRYDAVKTAMGKAIPRNSAEPLPRGYRGGTKNAPDRQGK